MGTRTYPGHGWLSWAVRVVEGLQVFCSRSKHPDGVHEADAPDAAVPALRRNAGGLVSLAQPSFDLVRSILLRKCRAAHAGGGSLRWRVRALDRKGARLDRPPDISSDQRSGYRTMGLGIGPREAASRVG